MGLLPAIDSEEGHSRGEGVLARMRVRIIMVLVPNRSEDEGLSSDQINQSFEFFFLSTPCATLSLFLRVEEKIV